VILPVMDLSQQLGWGRTDPSGRHVIIVIRIGDHLRGLVVDAVNDIVTIAPEEIQPVPDIGEAVSARYLQGIANLGDRLIMILDLDRLDVGAATNHEAA
jgi:purine-binding chemotaxis protein CheW